MSGYYIIIIKGLDTGKSFPLSKKLVTIGRSPKSDIPLDDHSTSRDHARITFEDKGYLIEDLGSANGTQVNGKLIEGPTSLSPGDKIQIGLSIGMQFNAQMSDDPQPHDHTIKNVSAQKEPVLAETAHAPDTPPHATIMATSPGPIMYNFVVQSGSQANQVIPLGAGQHTLGREQDSKIYINDGMASNKHAIIQIQKEGIWIQDLSSANGTFINGQRITQSTWLQIGDTIQVGANVLLQVRSGSGAMPASSPTPSPVIATPQLHPITTPPTQPSSPMDWERWLPGLLAAIGGMLVIIILILLISR
jgi:pSer/pThr/pTyr-binding forkhead associated (FHA) protein